MNLKEKNSCSVLIKALIDKGFSGKKAQDSAQEFCQYHEIDSEDPKQVKAAAQHIYKLYKESSMKKACANKNYILIEECLDKGITTIDGIQKVLEKASGKKVDRAKLVEAVDQYFEIKEHPTPLLARNPDRFKGRPEDTLQANRYGSKLKNAYAARYQKLLDDAIAEIRMDFSIINYDISTVETNPTFLAGIPNEEETQFMLTANLAVVNDTFGEDVTKNRTGVDLFTIRIKTKDNFVTLARSFEAIKYKLQKTNIECIARKGSSEYGQESLLMSFSLTDAFTSNGKVDLLSQEGFKRTEAELQFLEKLIADKIWDISEELAKVDYLDPENWN